MENPKNLTLRKPTPNTKPMCTNIYLHFFNLLNTTSKCRRQRFLFLFFFITEIESLKPCPPIIGQRTHVGGLDGSLSCPVPRIRRSEVHSPLPALNSHHSASRTSRGVRYSFDTRCVTRGVGQSRFRLAIRRSLARCSRARPRTAGARQAVIDLRNYRGERRPRLTG